MHQLAETRLTEREEAEESERTWREKLHEATDELRALAKDARVSRLPAVGKPRRGVGGGKGEKRWPMWMVQLILEQLIHGTPPAAIPDNILSHDRLMTGRDGPQGSAFAGCAGTGCGGT